WRRPRHGRYRTAAAVFWRTGAQARGRGQLRALICRRSSD
ncbi:MAG: hypothetical protein AVDCRST_MAG77-759, partial [uncultured Chloroflexi bacterium]